MLKVITYVHAGEQKIVSKVCPECNEVKLTADFKTPTVKGMLTSICLECDERKGESA